MTCDIYLMMKFDRGGFGGAQIGVDPLWLLIQSEMKSQLEGDHRSSKSIREKV